MAPRTITPGLRALDPFTPIGHTSFGPIWPAAGGRAGSRGVDILVGDEDDPDPFDDDDDDERDDDDEGDDERQRAQDRRDAARGWQREKPRERTDRDDEDERDDDRDERRRASRNGRNRREEPDDTNGDEEEWEPPTREAWERMTEAVTRNNHELRKRRFLGKPLEKLGITDEESLRNKLLELGVDPDTGQRLNGYDGTDDDLDEDQGGDEGGEQATRRSRADVIAERRRHEERGRAYAEARYKPGMAYYAAEAMIREAGWSGKDLGLALKLIDPDEIDVDFDETGWPTVVGLDEQIERIKGEFPEWFRPRRSLARDGDEHGDERRTQRRPQRTGARDVDGGERRRPAERPQSWLQRADDQLMGRGRRR